MLPVHARSALDCYRILCQDVSLLTIKFRSTIRTPAGEFQLTSLSIWPAFFPFPKSHDTRYFESV